MAEVYRADLGPGIVDQLSESLLAVISLVDLLLQSAFTKPTPCRGWNVLDVINHLAAVTERFGCFAAGADEPIRQRQGDFVGSEPPVGFRRYVNIAIYAWTGHPEVVEAVCVLPFGRFNGATAAGINLFDAVVHQWDIAVGAGVDVEVSDDLAIVALKVADLLITDGAKMAAHYVAAMSVAPDSGPLVRLLAATGRPPTWP